MTRLLGLAAGALLAFGTTSAMAEDRLVVVELYTSQGCSSCPPADALLTELAQRSEVLPLALHVDYWDYIGWKDNFAQSGFTQRQKAYAHAAAARSVYTPQMVVGGQDHLVGTHELELNKLIEAHQAIGQPVSLSLTKTDGGLTIRADAVDLEGAGLVQLVRFTPEETVEIRRGENAGRVITYTNIVTEWREIGRWEGDAPLFLEAELTGDEPVAVILQKEGYGPILAAAVLK